ncbi:pyruvate kinase [Salinibaculum salinum]|uniref:pyruvate kinase n=1 Tax=Salinibaculum salinum TaxID=3131996 RepID=UPI0030EC6B7D
MRNAKIVCTIGPSSRSPDRLRALAESGMDIVRMNGSHGTPSDRAALVDRVREVGGVRAKSIPILHDLPGPEIRTANGDESVALEAGSRVRFVQEETLSPDEIGLTESITAVEPGDRVLLDDGRIETVVEEVDGPTVRARVESGGDLGSRKGVNVPGVDLDLPVITARDRRELEVAVSKGVDFVAASFIRSGEDIYEISEYIDRLGGDIPIVAKIERADAVQNLDSIIDAAYGVMVARGDLGVECPMEEVPIVQKRIIRSCHEASVPVITATEMLDSMVHERRPTRAEASDVANAVLDGTDALMLSGETAIGDHPAQVVETMDSIIRDVEGSGEYTTSREQRVPAAGETKTDALARSARYLARDIDASAVITVSESGYTALKAAKYRPDMPIVAVTPNEQTRNQLRLSWGITAESVLYDAENTDTVVQTAVQTAIDIGVVSPGDTVVILAGMMTEFEDLDTSNMLKVHVAAETLASGRSIVEGLVSGPLAYITDGDFTAVPDGAILVVPEAFEEGFEGDLERIGGIIDTHGSVTGYAAIVARELSVPMIADADLPSDIPAGTVVTLDAERGVVYETDRRA